MHKAHSSDPGKQESLGRLYRDNVETHPGQTKGRKPGGTDRCQGWSFLPRLAVFERVALQDQRCLADVLWRISTYCVAAYRDAQGRRDPSVEMEAERHPGFASSVVFAFMRSADRPMPWIPSHMGPIAKRRPRCNMFGLREGSQSPPLDSITRRTQQGQLASTARIFFHLTCVGIGTARCQLVKPNSDASPKATACPGPRLPRRLPQAFRRLHGMPSRCKRPQAR